MAKTLTIRIPEKEAAGLARVAEEERRTRTELVRAYLRWLAEAPPEQRRAFLARISL